MSPEVSSRPHLLGVLCRRRDLLHANVGDLAAARADLQLRDRRHPRHVPLFVEEWVCARAAREASSTSTACVTVPREPVLRAPGWPATACAEGVALLLGESAKSCQRLALCLATAM